jgi:hypothetical protein
MKIDFQDIIVINVKKEHNGCPAISYDNPNEKISEGIILIEEGEYRCTTCNNLIALYRKFNNK